MFLTKLNTNHMVMTFTCNYQLHRRAGWSALRPAILDMVRSYMQIVVFSKSHDKWLKNKLTWRNDKVYVKIVLYSSVTPLSEGKIWINRKMIDEAIYIRVSDRKENRTAEESRTTIRIVIISTNLNIFVTYENRS